MSVAVVTIVHVPVLKECCCEHVSRMLLWTDLGGPTVNVSMSYCGETAQLVLL